MPFNLRARRPALAAVIACLLILGLLAPPTLTSAAPSLAFTPLEQARELLERMTPEEKVGQLFLVSFRGSDAGPTSAISNMVTNLHIGGAVLRADNDNIVGDGRPEEATPRQVYDLVRQIQLEEWNGSLQSQINPITGEAYLPSYIPLFIGMAQEGNGYPNDQVLYGLTDLPNQMALGATWTPQLASLNGETLGKELTTLGINLFLGPSLDVLETSGLETSGTMGTRTFGGDPYWVSQMASAYIRGVHLGSQGSVAVVAKHFPGHGSSDRLPEAEVATVRKSLEELASFDLAPFFAVTGAAATPEETTDALLTSHIRYQGLQGNIRATTRPVSFDPQALSLLLSMPVLDVWRQNGGVMVSDDLSNQAVRRFYDLTSQTFEARRVALNAFLAGNDLLYVADFTSGNIPDQYQGTARTLDFFAQKYREDQAFSQRVDESVLRLLTLKYRIYPTFSFSTVLNQTGNFSGLGTGEQTTLEIARQAATLLSPSQTDLDSTIPDPPNQNDRIVFITDTRSGQQCSTCPEFPQIPLRALQDSVLRLYGPQAGGEVGINNLTSYSLDDLQAMLDNQAEGADLENALARANWIVLAMLDGRPDLPAYHTLTDFLSERPDLFQQKRLIVFAFGAPYFLDATDISKLTAYYALYGKTPPFIDTAAYLLFSELRATGASPVSVQGIDYNLNEALFPDPALPIPLEIELQRPAEMITGTVTPVPTPAPEYRVGDVIPLKAGPILDHNGNTVPDGTPVDFIFSLGGEANTIRQRQFTQQGTARITYSIPGPGNLAIHAESENAISSPIQLDIPAPGEETATAIPTETPTPSPTVVPPTPTPRLIVITQSPPATPARQPGVGDWAVAVLVASGLALIVYRLAAARKQARWGLRAGLLMLACGLAGYSYIILELPGSQALLDSSIPQAVLISTLAGSLAGLLIAFGWRTAADYSARPVTKEKSS